MEMILSKKEYTFSEAVRYAIRMYGEEHITNTIEAGKHELNHIIVIQE